MVVAFMCFLFLPVFATLAYGGGLHKTGLAMFVTFLVLGGLLLS